MKIAILCADKKSHYWQLADKYDLDIYDKERDCRKFKFDCPVITHAPCAQWSKLKAFSRFNPDEKDLAWFCFNAVSWCGGIFEHPSGSSFFKESGCEKTKIYSVNLSWFGYTAIKRTLLYYNQTSLLSHPLSFNAIEHVVSLPKKRNKQTLQEIGRHNKARRYITPISFNEWLIQSILNDSKSGH